jgi:hypothetical protein
VVKFLVDSVRIIEIPLRRVWPAEPLQSVGDDLRRERHEQRTGIVEDRRAGRRVAVAPFVEIDRDQPTSVLDGDLALADYTMNIIW